MRAISEIRSFLYYTFLCGLIVCIPSCSDNDSDAKNNVTDYSVADNWLYVSEEIGKPADVFFAYPTTYMGDDKFCAVTDEGMRAGAGVIRNRYATVYEESTNLFMPYYRQANATYALTLPDDEQDKLMRDIPAKDVIAAFRYYLDHYNNGRPFILAGHSQGSNCILYVMEYIKDRPELMKRFICAYVIGYSVTKDYLSKNSPLKFVEGRTDTGVIISWNTESPGITVPNPVVKPGALAVNPITWTTDESHASELISLGASIEESPGMYVKKEHFADAKVNKERGVIVCSTVDPEDYKLPASVFPVGVLHGCDYPFYYYDLQQNVKDRVNIYFQIN